MCYCPGYVVAMTESKQVSSLEDPRDDFATPAEDVLPATDDMQKSPDSKSKKKKRRTKLKNLLSGKADPQVSVAEMEDALSSISPEETKALSKEEQHKLDLVIKKMNELMATGKKDIADHKFWKTQPVLKFGILCVC